MQHLRDAVWQQIEWDPRLDSRHIDVVVRDGVVRLRGFVHLPGQRMMAEQAARSVAGVSVVANELAVKAFRSDSID